MKGGDRNGTYCREKSLRYVLLLKQQPQEVPKQKLRPKYFHRLVIRCLLLLLFACFVCLQEKKARQKLMSRDGYKKG